MLASNSRIKSLIFATVGAADGYALAMPRSFCTTSITSCVPCWIAGDGWGGEGAAAVGAVGDAGGAAESFIPGGGVSGDAMRGHQTFLCACFGPFLKCG